METQQGIKLVPHDFARERQELDTLLQSGNFAPSSNAARMLRYISERHFENPDELIGEYEVAVYGLGRKPSFDSQKDSIVRVEAHRVRRRLQEYYETEGTGHSVQISLPRGHYTPHFTLLTSPAENLRPAVPRPEIKKPVSGIGAQRRLVWYMVAVVAFGLGAFAVLNVGISRSSDVGARPAVKLLVSGALATGDSVHILAARTSGLYVDRMGTQWGTDAWYNGGNAGGMRYYSLALADDPAIYKTCRIGKDFGYDIPLHPGNYEMRLMFAESGERVPIMGEIGEGVRSMQVFANGSRILPPPDGRHRRSLDIIADAGGVDTADVKVFKDISPAADGKLHLRFLGSKEVALVNAIEIIPGLKGRMRALRWHAGDAPYADQQGNQWLEDHNNRGVRSSRFHGEVSGTEDPGLYQGERFGSFAYSVPVVSGSSYTVTIHFAENYFGVGAKTLTPPRIFNVYANYLPLLRDFDVTKAAGGPARAVTRIFRGIRPNPFDKINLAFEPVTEFAVDNAIEVEDESR